MLDKQSKIYVAGHNGLVGSAIWLDLLHRNKYLTDEQFKSIYADCEELVKVLVHRCKKLDENGTEK